MNFFSIIFFTGFALFVGQMASFAAQTNVSVLMTENGFEPRELTVETGMTVTFVNKDKVDHWPASNLHPTHGMYPMFDPKMPVGPGNSWQFTFENVGQWKYHDHLFPHMRGTIVVIGETTDEQESNGLLSKIYEWVVSIKESILGFLGKQKTSRAENLSVSDNFSGSVVARDSFRKIDNIIATDGLEKAWQYIIATYSGKAGSEAHDLAHYLGGRIYELKGFDGLAICTASFAYGCYHGFAEHAFENGLSTLSPIAKACESVGKINSGPWSSCIHGIGHGVATYFDTVDLSKALATCDQLTNGQTYCHDGVFMEFVTSAPQSVYNAKDPLHPCNTLSKKYRAGCARNQPRAMEKFLGMNVEQIINVCADASDKTIQYHCIDAIGLDVGQKSQGDPKRIANECAKFGQMEDRAQCTGAAAGEIVFQNFNGWETQAPLACDGLSQPWRRECHKRVSETIASYAAK